MFSWCISSFKCSDQPPNMCAVHFSYQRARSMADIPACRSHYEPICTRLYSFSSITGLAVDTSKAPRVSLCDLRRWVDPLVWPFFFFFSHTSAVSKESFPSASSATAFFPSSISHYGLFTAGNTFHSEVTVSSWLCQSTCLLTRYWGVFFHLCAKFCPLLHHIGYES